MKKGERFLKNVRLRWPVPGRLDRGSESGSAQNDRSLTSSRKDPVRSSSCEIASWHAASRTNRNAWRLVRSKPELVRGSKPELVRSRPVRELARSKLVPELVRSRPVPVRGNKPELVRSKPVLVHRPEHMRCGDRTTYRSNRRRSWGPRSIQPMRTSRTKQLTSFPPPIGCERV